MLMTSAVQYIDVGFGTGHEDAAIEECVRRYGWEVGERNSKLMEWLFRKCSVNIPDIESNNDDRFVVHSVEPISRPCPVHTTDISSPSQPKNEAKVLTNMKSIEIDLETPSRININHRDCESTILFTPKKRIKTISKKCIDLTYIWFIILLTPPNKSFNLTTRRTRKSRRVTCLLHTKTGLG